MLRELPWGHGMALIAVMVIAVVARGELLFDKAYAPGADYGHTLLFAEQVQRLGDIPSAFPFHQMGLTNFHSSPGLPLEFLALDSALGLPDLKLTGFALVFSSIGVMGMYMLGKAIAGSELGLMAALIYAVLPANLEILGWAGYANIYALALTPFFWWTVARVRSGFSFRLVWLAALLASAIALVHLLTALLVGGATLLALALDLTLAQERTKLLRTYAYLCGATILLSLPTLAFALQTQLSRDESLAFWSLDIVKVTRLSDDDYPRFFSGLGLALATVGLAVVAARKSEWAIALCLVMSLLLLSTAVAYSWLLGISFYYERALYFAAVPLSILVAYALSLVRWPAGRLGLVAVVVGTMSLAAVRTAPSVAEYYSLLDGDSLSAMEWIRQRTSPDDVVVSDGCLGFLWEYVGQRPTAVAFNPIQLSSAREEAIAADARRILQSRAAAADLLEDYGVRYLIYDSGCPDFNPNVVFENLNNQPSLQREAIFGSVYVYKTTE